MIATLIRQRFELGTCVITPAAREHLAAAGVAEGALLSRHATGDWGDLCHEDFMENERSIVRGWRILSSYPLADDVVWVITEADRSTTTIFMRAEY
jgi:hypothetical protein